MEHELTESQELIRRAAADLFGRRYDLATTRELQAGPVRYHATLWSDICDLGWTALPFPEYVGGVEGSLLDAAVLVHEFGRAAATTPYVHSCIAAGLALAPDLPDLASDIASGIALVIPAVATGEALESTELGTDGRTRLTGSVVGVPWLPLATHLLVKRSNSWVLVDADSDGLSSVDLATSTAEPLATVQFDAVEGVAVRPRSNATDPFLLGATGQAVALSGLASRALEVAIAYANERVQFGRRIASFQALQHKAADMYVAIEAAKNLSFKAAWAHSSAPDSFGRLARFSKSMSGDAASFVTRQSIQLHGGVAFVDHHVAQLFYLNAITAASSYGSGQQHRELVANSLLMEAG
jgi:alkylation response protein AidB-like acyl-CoA dehydrogenase